MTMDLSEFETVSGPRGPRCGVQIAIGRLEAKDQAKLKEALRRVKDTPEHRRIKNTEIAKWLKDHGVPLSPMSVSRHRRQECACDDRPE